MSWIFFTHISISICQSGCHRFNLHIADQNAIDFIRKPFGQKIRPHILSIRMPYRFQWISYIKIYQTPLGHIFHGQKSWPFLKAIQYPPRPNEVDRVLDAGAWLAQLRNALRAAVVDAVLEELPRTANSASVPQRWSVPWEVKTVGYGIIVHNG